jgi:hypothetical protein
VLADSAVTAKVVTIIVAPTARRPGRYEARLDDGTVLVTASRQPFLDVARKLIDLGRDPAAVLTMRWRGSEIDCLIAPIGVAAKLTVDEHNGTRFAKWKALPRSAVSPPVRQKGRAAA